MDQIANMINMIKNASLKGHEFIVVPHSKVKFSIAECLVKEGYIKNIQKKIRKGFPIIEIALLYAKNGDPKVTGASRVSKSSCRVYKGIREFKYNRNHFGVTIMSTPKGILTDKQAKREMVGGEVLFKIW